MYAIEVLKPKVDNVALDAVEIANELIPSNSKSKLTPSD